MHRDAALNSRPTMTDSYSYFKALVDRYPTPYNLTIERILDVNYAYLKLDSQDDLYFTKYALPYIELLNPSNFLTDRDWYKRHSQRLSGSSCTYKVRTKAVNGCYKDVVLKWNRMGEEIPAGDEESESMIGVKFNSPFEEFSLVMEVRKSKYESRGAIITQQPLLIYVPYERVELWRSGRKEYIMQHKIDTHKEVELDMFRSYVTVYEWIEGIDAARAFEENLISEKEMVALVLRADEEMKHKGYRVRDRKPHHIIIRPKNAGDFSKGKGGKVLSAIIDYELLERTPDRDRKIKKAKRDLYLRKQKDRFVVEYQTAFPQHLKHVNILGVDYVYGHVESTDGALWVVGKDRDLFDYFLPERWENTPRKKLSASHEIYYTLTKDNINLVWKVSKVGVKPDLDPFREDDRKILGYGFNSPFEEVSIAVKLSAEGIRTVYPRAIYMVGRTLHISDSILDKRRYQTHRFLLTPDGEPVLKEDRRYLIIWGYWNGPDERLAMKDGDYLEGISALDAYRESMITQETYIDLLNFKKSKMARAGIEDLNLKGNHLLLSLDGKGHLVGDKKGLPEMRVCNFELLRSLG